MYNPIATYRIQFHKEFTFSDFERILSYLQQLGVSTIYASPVFESVPGSTHGYDGVNPLNINPEIGTIDQLKELHQRLEDQNMGWLQDIVPNHMAFHPANKWLMDVLEKGPQSEYASFFDSTAWTSPLYHGRIMVPFLGDTLENVIKNEELNIVFANQRLAFRYFDALYPLKPRTYITILQNGNEPLPDAVELLISQITDLKQIEEPKEYTERWDELRLQLTALMKNGTTKDFIENRLKSINTDPNLLLQIAEEQTYRLCHWQETDKQINYRRFFTINGLICLNIQDEKVFQSFHQFIKSLVDEGVFQGLRIDHIDGLFNPTAYLEQLRQLVGEHPYIVVEKILEPGEQLPQYWPVQGTTGYDFLAMVNNLLTDKRSEEQFSQFYENLTGDSTAIHQQLRIKKVNILFQQMSGELENLFRFFKELNLVDKRAFASFRQEDLKMAIAEFLVQCPVYRYYGNRLPLEGEEAAAVQHTLNRVRKTDMDLSDAVSVLETALLHKPHERSEDYNSRALLFYQRCMQFTGPLMAKGVEDTLMYTYNRFIGHNEVGDAPEAFGFPVEEFHRKMQERQEHWPLALNATSTHDTKRGEDVRARLNVLTDMAGEWLQTVEEWQELNTDLKEHGVPDENDEYFIYQNLMGTYPLQMEDEAAYGDRLKAYMQKALREAKVHSNWAKPDEAYETATQTFITRLLDKERPFWKSFQQLLAKVADFGIINSLTQVLLKFTCPGSPDLYQGCELWDFSFVDPDNRRPVNFELRQQLLTDIDENGADETFLQKLWQNRQDAHIKLWLTYKLFQLRRQYPELFEQGEYIPLKVEGACKEHVLAFARLHRRTFYLVALPLHLARLCQEQEKDIMEIDWKDTRILAPEGALAEWEHLFTKEKQTRKKGIAVTNIFKHFPFALLKGKQVDNERGAGILLHLTSLPSRFGIGDMGPEAKAFASFLSHSNQKYWQILPLNPTEGGQGHSPYSAISSMAGNPLLISPELLAKDELLTAKELPQYYLPQQNTINFTDTERVKDELLQKAYQAFCEGKAAKLRPDFEQYCEQEAAWLNDFALYKLLKKLHEGKAWFQWPEKYKKRQPKALEALAAQHTQEIDKAKWLQFIFDKQYKELKHYCNEHNIKLLGDLPIYVSYDSVDVWSHRDIFCLDKDGNMTGIAGVPPDAFSDDGQLWGMPVYRWDVLKERGYDWWVNRLRRNQELFDLVRLDHFRAFADYWEVPAGETTARNGEWKPGPGAHFFQTIEQELKELPFVAEDLGEINDAVFHLRDQFHLPGMKVLQFAFGEDMPYSDYIPHNFTPNFIAYTGTHDNNTVRGWFRQNTTDKERRNVEMYVGKPLSEGDIHLVMGRIAYGSVAKIAILPIQDVLGLDEHARMNTPASGDNNWRWRLVPGQLTVNAEHLLQHWTWMYNRE